MVLNYIWIAFFLIAFVTALMRLVFLGDTQVFPEIINSTFNSSKTAFEISLGLTGVLSLWLGIMRIGEQGGVITLFSRLLGTYLVNGNMIPIIRAGLGVLLGLATQSEAEPAEEEPATEETTSAEKEGDENGETTDARQPV